MGCVFYRDVTLMSNERLVYYDLLAQSYGWLFYSPLAGGRGHIVAVTLQAV